MRDRAINAWANLHGTIIDFIRPQEAEMRGRALDSPYAVLKQRVEIPNPMSSKWFAAGRESASGWMRPLDAIVLGQDPDTQ